MSSGQPFGAEEIGGYIYETLVYSNLASQKQVQKTYGDYFMSITAYDFLTWAFKVQIRLWIARERREAHG